MTPTRTSFGVRIAGWWIAGLAIALAALVVGTTAFGWDYYALDRAARTEHPLHALLASGAPGGVALGMLGTTLMIAMLSYTVRKRFAHVQLLGPLPMWLRFHVVCGVMGPLLIVLHSGLQLAPRGLISVGFWCMVLVALSGVFGRYVYGFLPRMEGGRAIAWGDGMNALADLRARLVQATALSGGHAIGQAVALARDLDAEAHTIPDLFRLDREVRRRRAHIHELLVSADLDEPTRRQAQSEIGDQLALKRSLEASRVAYRLFRYWHLFHRPLAAAMYVIVSIHVLSALLLGGSLGHLAELWGGSPS